MMPTNYRAMLLITMVTLCFGVSLVTYSNLIGELKLPSGYTTAHVETVSSSSEKPTPQSSQLDFTHLIVELYKPFIHDVDAPSFKSNSGREYHVSHEPQFRKPLGHRVLILNVDTRTPIGQGGLLNKTMEYDEITPQTAGMMNHYLYAKIHGYDYKFVKAPIYEGRHQTWVKVPLIREALKAYDFVVFLDTDAVFRYHHMPLEWLFNYWNIQNDTLILMATDPIGKINEDDFGRLNHNTGFIIAQSTERTFQMFNDWEACVSEEHYVGCAKWATEFAHEQSAFSNYLRYEYTRPNDIVSLACDEANGFPAAAQVNCTGEFVRHYWATKDSTLDELRNSVTRYATARLHDEFHRGMDDYVVDASNYRYPFHDDDTPVI